MKTEAIVRTHITLDTLGKTSIKALQSSIRTHPLVSLKDAHNVSAVKDKLANRNHFASRCHTVHTTFSIAVATKKDFYHLLKPLITYYS